MGVESDSSSSNEGQSKAVPDYCQVLRFKDSSGQVKELIFPKALDLDRPKRPRTTFSPEQLCALEEHFSTRPYLVGSDRKALANRLGLSETQIKVWFQNRRTKSKREQPTNSVDNSNSTQQISSHQEQSPVNQLSETEHMSFGNCRPSTEILLNGTVPNVGTVPNISTLPMSGDSHNWSLAYAQQMLAAGTMGCFQANRVPSQPQNVFQEIFGGK